MSGHLVVNGFKIGKTDKFIFVKTTDTPFSRTCSSILKSFAVLDGKTVDFRTVRSSFTDRVSFVDKDSGLYLIYNNDDELIFDTVPFSFYMDDVCDGDLCIGFKLRLDTVNYLQLNDGSFGLSNLKDSSVFSLC